MTFLIQLYWSQSPPRALTTGNSSDVVVVVGVVGGIHWNNEADCAGSRVWSENMNRLKIFYNISCCLTSYSLDIGLVWHIEKLLEGGAGHNF